MEKYLILFFIVFPFQTLKSNNYANGARSNSMANASVALTDEWSAFNNQAGLVLLDKISIGSYYENRFGLKELSTKALVFNYPSAFGSFSFNYTQFGFDLYKESKLGVAYAKRLGKNIWMGVQLNRIDKAIQPYNASQNRYTFEIGLLTEIAKNIHLGFHLNNPTQVKFTTWEHDDRIPTIGRLGISWKLSNGAFINSEILKDLDSNFRLKTGLEFQARKNLFLRCGVCNHPNLISFGIGYNYKQLKTNTAFSKHPILGYSPSIDITFQI